MPERKTISATKKQTLKRIKNHYYSLEREHLEETNQSREKEKKRISLAMKRLISLDDENGIIMTHAMCLLCRIMNSNHPTFRRLDIFKIYVVCVFISFKFLDEELILELSDMEKLTGCKKVMLKELEKLLLIGILEFDIFVSEREYELMQRTMRR